MRAFIMAGTPILNQAGQTGMVTGDQRKNKNKVLIAIRWGNGKITWQPTNQLDYTGWGAKLK